MCIDGQPSCVVCREWWRGRRRCWSGRSRSRSSCCSPGNKCKYNHINKYKYKYKYVEKYKYKYCSILRGFNQCCGTWQLKAASFLCIIDLQKQPDLLSSSDSKNDQVSYQLDLLWSFSQFVSSSLLVFPYYLSWVAVVARHFQVPSTTIWNGNMETKSFPSFSSFSSPALPYLLQHQFSSNRTPSIITRRRTPYSAGLPDSWEPFCIDHNQNF